jgi:hypothetical protein
MYAFARRRANRGGGEATWAAAAGPRVVVAALPGYHDLPPCDCREPTRPDFRDAAGFFIQRSHTEFSVFSGL